MPKYLTRQSLRSQVNLPEISYLQACALDEIDEILQLVEPNIHYSLQHIKLYTSIKRIY